MPVDNVYRRRSIAVRGAIADTAFEFLCLYSAECMTDACERDHRSSTRAGRVCYSKVVLVQCNQHKQEFPSWSNWRLAWCRRPDPASRSASHPRGITPLHCAMRVQRHAGRSTRGDRSLTVPTRVCDRAQNGRYHTLTRHPMRAKQPVMGNCALQNATLRVLRLQLKLNASGPT